MEKEIGVVTHFFDKLSVAVIKLTKGPLSVGDTIKIKGGEDTDFDQEVDSMQIEHEKIAKAKKGDEVGMKVKKIAREGYKVFLVK